MNFIWTFSLPQKLKSILCFFILFQTAIYWTILTFLAHYVSIVFGEATFKIFKWKIAITRFNLKIGCVQFAVWPNIKAEKVVNQESSKGNCK